MSGEGPSNSRLNTTAQSLNGAARPTTPVAPKAIGSLAKRQSDVTRSGSQKLKFIPTIPARRKKEDVKEEQPTITSAPSRGQGRGRGRGRGDGRGAAPRSSVEMTASGPFAMGPTLAGTSTRRSVPRSNFAPITPNGPGKSAALGAGLSHTAAPSLKQEKDEEPSLNTLAQAKSEDNDDTYSDPDEGVEIIDMENIRQMDWMAPESLKKERKVSKKKLVKIESDHSNVGNGKIRREETVNIEEAAAKGEVDLANALDLSESEEEEELEDLIKDFALQIDQDQDIDVRQERLYFFQFPEPFPTFRSKARPAAHSEAAPINLDAQGSTNSNSKQKRVSFAADAKSPAPGPSTETLRPSVGSDSKPALQDEDEKKDVKLDGVIGQLEVHRSGAVKMRLGNGVVYDVSAATQPSFLQHAVYLDVENKRLNVLGEVNKRFMVSPDLDALLEAMEVADREAANQNLIKMDTT